MKRVLLLSEPGLDFQAGRAVQALAANLGKPFDVTSRSLNGGDASAFHHLKLFQSIKRESYDLIHARGLPALLMASLAQAGPMVFSFSRSPSRSQLRWLRAVMSYRTVHVICPTSTMHRFCVERGVPVEHCHLIRPGVEFGRVNRRRDAALRAALGFAESDHVLLLPGESTEAANHAAAVWAVSILNVLDPKYRLLLWGPGDRSDSVRQFAARQNQPNLVSVATQKLGRVVEFEELVAAADGVLVTASGSVATLPIAVCMAAGLPIVSTVTSEVAELLEDRHTALMVPRTTPRAIARRVLDLRADKNIQWSIADMAKTEAFEYFANSRFMNQHRAVYNQVLAGEPVAVPQAAPGAGLRFHGLG